MPALHLLHRRLELHLPVSLYQHLCFWSEVIPSILAAVRSRVAVMEPSRLERSIESQQAFCVGAKPEIEHAAQPVRAKPEDAPEVRRVLDYSSLPLGTACTAYLQTQAYFHKPQGHPPQFWYCETCMMGMIHSCPPDSTAPYPSGSCYDQGTLGLRSSALPPKGRMPAPKSSEKEPCTLSKLSSSPLLSWMAACCLIAASALAL